MDPNPRLNPNTKKEKTHYIKRLRKARSNSQRLRHKPVSNQPVKLHTSSRGVFLQLWVCISLSKESSQGFKTAKLFFFYSEKQWRHHTSTQFVFVKCADADQSTTASQHLLFLHDRLMLFLSFLSVLFRLFKTISTEMYNIRYKEKVIDDALSSSGAIWLEETD